MPQYAVKFIPWNVCLKLIHETYAEPPECDYSVSVLYGTARQLSVNHI